MAENNVHLLARRPDGHQTMLREMTSPALLQHTILIAASRGVPVLLVRAKHDA